jgi:hypothetical protein
MSSLIYFILFNSAFAAQLARKRPRWKGSRLQILWSKGANLTNIAVASRKRRSTNQTVVQVRKTFSPKDSSDEYAPRKMSRTDDIHSQYRVPPSVKLPPPCMAVVGKNKFIFPEFIFPEYWREWSRKGDRGSPQGDAKEGAICRHRKKHECEMQWELSGEMPGNLLAEAAMGGVCL